MVPVWLTVRVPADARPGLYRGKVRVRLRGGAGVDVPLRLDVADWRIPDPADWVSHNNLYHSHDTTALVYGKELWSDEHFDLMGRSLDLGRQLGNKLCITPLVVRNYCIGNSQSMVRWIDTGGGGYAYDFSVFDRYLDLYERTCGKPGILLLDMWGRYSDRNGFAVTLVDAKTLKPVGEIEKKPDAGGDGKPLPTVFEENVDFWRPMFQELLTRLEKRGWLDVALIGTGSDTVPTRETVSALKQVWPGYRWFAATHMSPSAFRGKEGSVPVAGLEHVWGAGHLYRPGSKGGKYPGCSPSGRVVLAFPRTGQGFIRSLNDESSLVKFRFAPEGSLQGGVKGIGRVGLDYLPIPGRNVRSGRQDLRNAPLCGGSHLGCNASTMAFISAGPDGPAANERFEMFREGMQIREAIIFIRNSAGKVGGDLAGRIWEHLDLRAHHYGRTRIRWKGQPSLWTALAGSGWQRRDAELFALAAEVKAGLRTGR
jgi:hypothetical protein